MKYVSASDILPEPLLQEVQKYIQGSVLYIPSPEGGRRKWGQASGYRDYLLQRNAEMKARFHKGVSLEQLSDFYCLSEESVKKIVYKKKK
ncbi:CD3324 family protein [Paenibacillus sp. NEAU-GSW1]|uniref:CD3324 family protein n=1 Tax=Paenibacillus sp. NEAU-GSW1 TaxID=2682486 RepID=UPI0012E2232F|nr:CD3324 family protein [Paenibacillus sp. NEAU-GSW1]MUT68291.1 hypothetical protein [Paenibacillus sp. NEAU-GSW1]